MALIIGRTVVFVLAFGLLGICIRHEQMLEWDKVAHAVNIRRRSSKTPPHMINACQRIPTNCNQSKRLFESMHAMIDVRSVSNFPPTLVLWASLTPIPEWQSLQCRNHTFPHPSVHRKDRYSCYCGYCFSSSHPSLKTTSAPLLLHSKASTDKHYTTFALQCFKVINNTQLFALPYLKMSNTPSPLHPHISKGQTLHNFSTQISPLSHSSHNTCVMGIRNSYPWMTKPAM